MADPHFDEREERLRQREIELRLRELETDVNRIEPPFHPTTREHGTNKPARTFTGDLALAVKLSGLFLTGVVIVYVSQWLAWISFFALIAASTWAYFKFGRQK